MNAILSRELTRLSKKKEKTTLLSVVKEKLMVYIGLGQREARVNPLA